MHIFFIGKRKSPGGKNDYRSKLFCMTRIILLSLSENWVQKILCHIFWPFDFTSFSLEPPKMISSRWEEYFSGKQSWDLRRKKGISFAREMDFFCSKLCALLSSLLLCASVNITASLRFLQTFHLKLFSSKEKFFLREKLFSKEKFFVFSWWWKNYLAVAAAAFLSCLTACRRISPESGREKKLGKMKINSSGI